MAERRALKYITMENEWRLFEKLAWPNNLSGVPFVQQIEMRKAFYAGYAQCLITLRDDISKWPDKDGASTLQSLLDEIENFWNVQVKEWDADKN